MNRIPSLLLAGAIATVAVAPVVGYGESRVYIPPKKTKSQLGYRNISGLNWREISKHYAPARNIDDWRKVISERHWKKGYSAYQIAHAWQNANPELPPEIAALFYGPVELLAAVPEHKTPLPGGRAPSQSDLLVFVRIQNRVCAVTVEGKKEEGFGQTVGEWSRNASAGKVKRLKHIAAKLGLAYPPAAEIRYQLLHRTAAAVIEAGRFNADCAAMLVHSFSPQHESFDDFAKFVNAFGIRSAKRDKIYKTDKPGMDLYFGWASPAGTVAVAETAAPEPVAPAPKPVAPAKPKPQPAVTETVTVAEVAAPTPEPAAPTPAKPETRLLGGNFIWILFGALVLVLAGIFFWRRNRKGPDAEVKPAQPAENAPAQTAEMEKLAGKVEEMHDKLNQVLEAMDSAAKIQEIESKIRELENKKDKTAEDELYQKGLEFEKFVVRIFDKDTEHFTLLDWSGDKGAGEGIYPQNASDPDLKYDFVRNDEKSTIAVECKWRGGFGFGFAEDYQLRNYKNYEEREGRKTFIVLGVGGKSGNPKRIFVIPVSDIDSAMLPERKLTKYEQKNIKNMNACKFWYRNKAEILKMYKPSKQTNAG